ncbi:hypothetical protein [Marinoscillum pacificum]|uniref:hypothetical protein n=1 Tax=Marinoscillum pacificum TaxID=392723 RepID=UPI0021571F53|nr:hypothetical protein [Marinoscillum pacificum]
MRTELKPNSYQAGDVVYAKVNPTLELTVRRYIDRVYYCRVKDDPDKPELVYYERELVTHPRTDEMANRPS